MNMNNMNMSMDMTPPSPPMHGGQEGMKKKMMMHMTFFWGQDVQILFSNWPGNHGLGMYLLALFVVFAVSVVVECLSFLSKRLSVNGATGGGFGCPKKGAMLALIHAVRTGLAYLVMLAVMSFNGGVFLAAVAGHCLGFFVAGSGFLGLSGGEGVEQGGKSNGLLN